MSSRFQVLPANDEARLHFLEQVRSGKSFQCQACGADKFWVLSAGPRRSQSCRFKNSVKTGSIFESSRLSLKTWLYAIWLFTAQKTGVSVLNLQKYLGLGSYRSAWLLLHKIRNSMIFADRSFLQGEVEVDEALSAASARASEGAGLKARNSLQLRPNVHGSIIHTDGWPSYNAVSKLGYKHLPRSSAAVNPDKLLPRISIVTALLKRWILGTLHGRLDLKHMDNYFEEFIFRFYRRTSKARGLLFQRVLENSVRVQPVPYQEIIFPKILGPVKCIYRINFKKWYDKIPSKKLVILQSNAGFNISGHVNCSRSLSDFATITPMS